MRRPRTAAWALVLAVTAGACGAPADDGGPAGSSVSQEQGSEAIVLGSSLAQIRGHHVVAAELYRAGDRTGALEHAGHPIDEILASIAPELEEHGGGAGDLESSLEQVRRLIHDGAPAKEVVAAIDAAETATGDAAAALAGEQAASAEHRGAIIAHLLATVAHEYEEAVAGGGDLKLVVEYQDAYGFLDVAHGLYGTIETAVVAASAEEAEEIAEAFDTLRTALPSVTPPAKLASALDVESAGALIGHELEETVGAQLVADEDPEEVGDRIADLLEEIVTRYRDGDDGGAAELAAEAYLENYEVIEAEVIDKAPAINEELEPLLGAELRRRIQEGAPVREIEDMVARAGDLLQQAIAALEDE